MSTLTKHVTAEEYAAMPQGGPRYQLVEGELIEMSPAPVTRHQRTVGAFFLRMASFVQAHGLGEVFVSPIDVYLSEESVFQPDVVFVSKARAKRVSKRGIEGAPDLVVEVLSPSTRRLDLKRKRKVYASAGVREALYVDLELDEITVFRFEEGRIANERRLERGDAYDTDLLPGFSAAVDDLIGPPEEELPPGPLEAPPAAPPA